MLTDCFSDSFQTLHGDNFYWTLHFYSQFWWPWSNLLGRNSVSERWNEKLSLHCKFFQVKFKLCVWTVMDKYLYILGYILLLQKKKNIVGITSDAAESQIFETLHGDHINWALYVYNRFSDLEPFSRLQESLASALLVGFVVVVSFCCMIWISRQWIDISLSLMIDCNNICCFILLYLIHSGCVLVKYW